MNFTFGVLDYRAHDAYISGHGLRGAVHQPESKMTAKQTLSYSVYTAQQDGATFDHLGAVEGARRKAVAYAKSAFPAWGYNGYGPTIVVADAKTGRRIVERRL